MPLSITFSHGDDDGMDSPGTCIKRERELRGFTLKDVHEATRIPVKNLRALEADDFEALPQQAFVKGYIRACCKYMGLDETDLVLRYELYIKDDTPVEEAAAPEKEKSPVTKAFSVSSKQMVAALVAVGVVIIVLFYLLSGSSKQVDVSEEAVAVKPEPVTAKKVSVPTTQTPPPPAVVHKASKPALNAAVPGHVLKVIATDDVWIKFSIDKKKPFDVLFKKGESRQWLMKKGVSLVIGNAAGVNLVFDGKPLKTGGKAGSVMRLKLPR